MNIIIINATIKLITAISLISITTCTMASTINMYDYSVFKNGINDVKWQRGSNSLNTMYFSTSGSQGEKWPSTGG